MKKILALLLAALMIVGMAACAPADDPETSGPNNDTSGADNDTWKGTIKVWTPTEDQAADNNWLVAMQERFEEAHPNYEITWDNGTMSEADSVTSVGGDVTAAADVYMFANDQLGKLIDAGGLSRLGGTFLEQVESDNSEFMVSTVTHTDGGVYGFPVSNNTWFLYYDKSVYSEEDVKSLETLLEKGKVVFPFEESWTNGCIFLGMGATTFGPAGVDAAAGIDLGEHKYDAARKMLQIAAHPNCVEGDQGVGQLISGEVDASFSGNWDAAAAREALGDDLGVAQLPTFTVDGEVYTMTAMSGAKCVGVNPNAGNVEGKQKVATEFAAFLASPEAQLARYEMRGVIPASTTLLENEKIQNDEVAVAEINTMANCAIVQSSLSEMNNWWTPMETFGKGIISGEVNEDNVEDQVDQLEELLNKTSEL